MGVAVKIEDGGTRAAEAVATQILVCLGVLDANHPAAVQYTHGPILNRRGINIGHMKPVEALAGWSL